MEMYVPQGGPPQGEGPSHEIYGIMGADNIYKMCDDFYQELEKSSIRALFSDDMKAASRKIAIFLIGLLGGPPLYHQTYGPPQMRRRHMGFAIDEQARQVWLGCFKKTLEGADKKYNFPEEHLSGFVQFLEDFSAWMVNRQ